LAGGGPGHAQAAAQFREAAELAAEIVSHSRAALLVNLRFLEPAIMRLAPERGRAEAEMATDGQILHYGFVHVCRGFQREPGLPARDLLHVVLHCLFRHLFVGPAVKAYLWDLACDAAVEGVINKLAIARLRCERAERQKAFLAGLSAVLPRLSAEIIYRRLLDDGIGPEDCALLRAPFYADDHRLWRTRPGQDQQPARASGPQEGGEEGPEAGARPDGPGPKGPPPDGQAGEEAAQASREGAELAVEGQDGALAGAAEEGEERGQARALAPEELERLWGEAKKALAAARGPAGDGVREGHARGGPAEVPPPDCPADGRPDRKAEAPLEPERPLGGPGGGKGGQ
jgi:hypothetical protein